MHETITVERLGRVSYRKVWELQKHLLLERISGKIGDRLLVCEHPAVVTIGSSGKITNVLASEEELFGLGIEVLKVERGGDVTFHGPGQVVMYPIIDLNSKKRDVGWYMRSLEEVVMRTLSGYGISGTRLKGRTGVWIDRSAPASKIAALGVKISRWCTMHGLSVNVNSCSDGFALINPCGYADIVVTSMEQELGFKFDIEDVADKLIQEFFKVFAYAERSDMAGINPEDQRSNFT